MKPRTYREAGVDIEREDQSIASLVAQLRFRRSGLGSPIELPGFFTGMIEFGDWVLTLNMDGVGTKLLVAEELNKWDTVGIDCVAMNVNDALCIGAEPLAMVDYFALGKYDDEVARQVGIGLNKGAEMANITIIGGELATIPEIVKGYDLVGTCLGCVRRDRIVDGRAVKPGDVIVGLPSSGLHSNGYTLARKLLRAEGVSYDEKVPGSRETYGEAMLRPTEIYVREVLQVLKMSEVVGMAHITGGGLYNIARIREGFQFEISEPLEPHPIFRALQDIGELDMQEMYTTFNMGMGFVLVMKEDEAREALKVLGKKRGSRIVGVVQKGTGVSVPALGFTVE